MGCTGAGLVAIVVLSIAVVLSIVSIALPAWSTSTISTTKTGTVEFSAGVWGYCTNIGVSTNSTDKGASVTFEHCYFFHTSSDYELPEVFDDSKVAANFSKYSLCDGYDRAATESDTALAQYSQELATLAGLDTEQFDRFLDRSCGPLGSATLTFVSLSLIAGVLAFVELLLGVTCCKNKSVLIGVGKVLSVCALLMTMLTFLAWLAQAHPLTKKDDVGYGGSFILSVLAALLYAIVATLAARHSKMG